MQGTTRRHVSAAVAGLLVVTLLVLRASSAAFTTTTTNPDNSFDVGAIALSDDDAGTALFTVTNMKPGDVETRCIDVTYTGDYGGADVTAVRLYRSGTVTDTGSIAPSFTLDVDLGTGPTDAACAGFSETSADVVAESLDTFLARADFAGGAGTGWTPASSPETVAFRVTVTLDAAATDAVQGQTLSGVGFTWEIQTT